MTEIITYLTENWDSVFSAITAVIAAAATVAALTPTPKDDGVLRVVRKAVDLIGMNFRHAKNK